MKKGTISIYRYVLLISSLICSLFPQKAALSANTYTSLCEIRFLAGLVMVSNVSKGGIRTISWNYNAGGSDF